MYKQCQIIMLPTDSKSLTGIGLHSITNKLLYSNSNNEWNKHFKLQHLYILSDEEIKEDNWYMVTDFSKQEDIRKSVKNITREEQRHNGYKKIIATTDSSLWEHDDTVPYPKTRPALPQPSQSFIEVFLREYNKGNIITDVLVEYESIEYARPMPMIHQKYYVDELKVNPKDNTITIKKVKDSWSREEVIELLKKSKSDFPLHRGIQLLDSEFDKWIKNNL